MLVELVKSIRLLLSERLTSPLLGAFVASWCVWNYETLLVLFSKEPVLAKLWIIDHLLYPSPGVTFAKGIFAPLMTAAMYLFAYPYPAKWVYTFTRQRQREILEIRRRIEDETPLTVEDSKKIRNELARAEQAYFSELDRKEGEIEKLKAQVSLLQKEDVASVDDRKTHDDDNEALPSALVNVLELIDRRGGRASEEWVIKNSGVPRIEAEFSLGELRKRNLISRSYDSSVSAYLVKFTHEGRAALLRSRSDANA